MPQWIIDLIKAFAPQIIDCITRDESAALSRLRRLEGIDAVRARRHFRSQGVPFRELDGRVRGLRSQLKEASDDDLREIVQMAKESAQPS